MELIKKIFSIKQIPILSWSSSEPLNLKPKINTFIYLSFGLFLFGLGETILIASSQGVSPWTVFAQGISINTNFSIGFATFIVSISVLLLWIPLKQKPGIGTILNAVIISIVLDYSYPYLPKPDNFFYQILQSFIRSFYSWFRKWFLFDCKFRSRSKRWFNDWYTKNIQTSNLFC